MIDLGIVMDPVATLHLKKDSTLAMIVAAQQRGWRVRHILPRDIYLEDGQIMAAMQDIRVDLGATPFWTLSEPVEQALTHLDMILMRKDPPFNLEYIYTTYLLEQVEASGTPVWNRPQSLRDCNEKLFATRFSHCGPPLVVSSRASVLQRFYEHHGDVILKPLDGMGGASIFRVQHGDPNLSVIIETLTEHGRWPIMAQRYLPEIRDGDKRILMIDGEPVPYALARIPADGETRGNLAAGGRGEARPLSERDRWICEQVAPSLKARGLRFVGLDVIGDYLTEINVTCPTCVRELDTQCGLDIGGQLLDALASDLQPGGAIRA